jgi:hypothetical protein
LLADLLETLPHLLERVLLRSTNHADLPRWVSVCARVCRAWLRVARSSPAYHWLGPPAAAALPITITLAEPGPLGFSVRQKWNAEGTERLPLLAVTHVEPGSAAALAAPPLSVHSELLSINGRAVKWDGTRMDCSPWTAPLLNQLILQQDDRPLTLRFIPQTRDHANQMRTDIMKETGKALARLRHGNLESHKVLHQEAGDRVLADALLALPFELPGDDLDLCGFGPMAMAVIVSAIRRGNADVGLKKVSVRQALVPVQLLEVLPPTVERLDISYGCGDDDMLALAAALPRLTLLRHLRWNASPRASDAAWIAFAEALPTLPALACLIISMAETGRPYRSRALKSTTDQEQFNSWPVLSGAGVSALAAALGSKRAQQFLYVELRDLKIDSDGRALLLNAKRSRPGCSLRL